MMLPQRARGGENRVKNKSSNGPRRVQSTALMRLVFCNASASVIVGDMLVSCKRTEVFDRRESRWHRG